MSPTKVISSKILLADILAVIFPAEFFLVDDHAIVAVAGVGGAFR